MGRSSRRRAGTRHPDLIEGDLATLAPSRDASGAERLRFGDMAVPRQIVDTILGRPPKTGVDPVYMMALADKESSFSTDVKAATSSRRGPVPVPRPAPGSNSIRAYGARHGLADEAAAVKGRGGAITIADEAIRTRVLRLRQDPYVAALMAGELIKRDRGRIEQRIGRDAHHGGTLLRAFPRHGQRGPLPGAHAEKPGQVARRSSGPRPRPTAACSPRRPARAAAASPSRRSARRSTA